MAGGTGATGCHFAGKACTRSLDACALPLCQFIERPSTPPLSPVHPSPVHRCVLLTNPSGGRALLSAGYPLGGYQTQSQSVRSRVCSFAGFPCSKTKLACLLCLLVAWLSSYFNALLAGFDLCFRFQLERFVYPCEWWNVEQSPYR